MKNHTIRRKININYDFAKIDAALEAIENGVKYNDKKEIYGIDLSKFSEICKTMKKVDRDFLRYHLLAKFINWGLSNYLEIIKKPGS